MAPSDFEIAEPVVSAQELETTGARESRPKISPVPKPTLEFAYIDIEELCEWAAVNEGGLPYGSSIAQSAKDAASRPGMLSANRVKYTEAIGDKDYLEIESELSRAGLFLPMIKERSRSLQPLACRDLRKRLRSQPPGNRVLATTWVLLYGYVLGTDDLERDVVRLASGRRDQARVTVRTAQPHGLVWSRVLFSYPVFTLGRLGDVSLPTIEFRAGYVSF